ncbi:hypothetical protein [Bacillus sp. REN3]|nr:hypothetical protein [Bacillus sp. REN3]
MIGRIRHEWARVGGIFWDKLDKRENPLGNWENRPHNWENKQDD